MHHVCMYARCDRSAEKNGHGMDGQSSDQEAGHASHTSIGLGDNEEGVAVKAESLVNRLIRTLLHSGRRAACPSKPRGQERAISRSQVFPRLIIA